MSLDIREYGYTVYTSMDMRYIDPEVGGLTLDSIAETCDGYLGHSVPFATGKVEINLILNRRLDRKYIVGQLEREFGFDGEEKVVLGIEEKLACDLGVTRQSDSDF